MVTIIKLLLSYSLNEPTDDLDKKFNEKLKIIQEKLKISDVNEWIITIRDALISASKLI